VPFGGLLTAGIGAAGLGLSAYNLFGGSGGSSQPQIQSSNPTGTILDQLLGLTTHTDTKNGTKYNTLVPTGGGLFGPTQISQIQDYLRNPLPLNAAELQSQAILGQVPGQLQNTENLLNNVLTPLATQGAQTGFPTDISSIINAANYQFQNQQLPQIREQFAGQTGTYGTDFLNAITRGLTGMDVNLGQLQYAASEAAKQRQQAYIPMASELGLAANQLPITTASDLFSLGSAQRQEQNTTRPGYSLLQGLGALTGLGTPGQQGYYAQGAYPSQTTQLLSGLSQGLGSLFSGLGAGTGVSNLPFSGLLTGASSQAGTSAADASNFFNTFNPSINTNVGSSLFGAVPGASTTPINTSP